jgi:hypothetical protein
MFERRILTMSIQPVVQKIKNADECGSLTCGYCSGGCTNCTTTCRGAASTKMLFVERGDDVELSATEVLKAFTEVAEKEERKRS